MELTSLPVWGEWIEIILGRLSSASAWSLPVWGEWIEMSIFGNMVGLTWRSLPVWGEWIEIGRWR